MLEEYAYNPPKELIANKPASPRDSARLFFYDVAAEKIVFDTFLNLGRYLPKNAVIVFNDTRVIPARVPVYKESPDARFAQSGQGGGRVRLLYIATKGDCIEVLADRKLAPQSTVRINKKYSFRVEESLDGSYLLKPSFPIEKLFSVLQKYGITPLPPYIKNSPMSEAEARKKYQTIFARTKGSVAVPTASLHFTPRLIKKLRKSGIETAFVTLHVNLGTFAPVSDEALKSGKLHKEYFEIPPKTATLLKKAKAVGRPIIAVGTTVARALESACAEIVTLSPSKGDKRTFEKFRLTIINGDTDLFIRPGYKFKLTDGLVTNFHVPRSSLMMLVSAFLDDKMRRCGKKPLGREKLLELYALAIAKKLQLFSFGDGMLII